MPLPGVTIITIITITCGSCLPDEVLLVVEVPPEAAPVLDHPAVRPWVGRNHAGTVLRRLDRTMRAISVHLPRVNLRP